MQVQQELEHYRNDALYFEQRRQEFLQILTPTSQRQRQVLQFIPSLLGRDIVSRFAFYVEERTNRVLLLEPHEAEALNLP